MATKIKFSFIKMFFRLFSFLADKTGGWKVFVQPKLMLGTMILGFGVAACGSSVKGQTGCYAKMPNIPQTDSINVVPCYEGNITDSTLLQEVPYPPILITTIQTTCYIRLDYDDDDTIQTDTTKITIEENDTTIYMIVDKKAEFTGGDKALFKFINDNIQFPPQLAESSIQGRVFCTFVVEKSGEITNIEVIRGVHPLLDKEAVRVIEIMPKWIPAEKNNKIVRSYFTLPVTFILRQ